MVVVVFAVGFDQEMVTVRDSGISGYLLDAHSLKLKSRQWTAHVVRQKLIDF